MYVYESRLPEFKFRQTDQHLASNEPTLQKWNQQKKCFVLKMLTIEEGRCR